MRCAGEGAAVLLSWRRAGRKSTYQVGGLDVQRELLLLEILQSTKLNVSKALLVSVWSHCGRVVTSMLGFERRLSANLAQAHKDGGRSGGKPLGEPPASLDDDASRGPAVECGAACKRATLRDCVP